MSEENPVLRNATERNAKTKGTALSPSEKAGPAAPEESPWNHETRTLLARLLREECRLYGEWHRRNMAWCKLAVERGATKGITPEDVACAIVGLPKVMRVRPPWNPCMVFKKANRGLFNQALSAGRTMRRRLPTKANAAAADVLAGLAARLRTGTT